MPFSDDLYSGDVDDPEVDYPTVDYPEVDDPDVDSFNDELSPADGYFERTIPSGAMVPDPSQVSDDKTVEDKVLIPRPDPRTGSGSSSRPVNSPTLEQLHPTHNNASSASSPTASSPVTSRSFNRIHPDALIMGAIAPPPAYSASPIPSSSYTPSSPQPPQDNRNYNTFQPLHLENHLEQGFLPSREPENMGRPEEEPNEENPLVGVRVERKSRRRTLLRKLLFVALILAVMGSILTTILNEGNSDPHKRPSKDVGPSPKVPGQPYCASATYHKGPIAYSFPLGGDVTVIQRNHDDSNIRGSQRIQTVGEIRLRRLQKDSQHGDGNGYATVEINVSHPDIEVEWTLEEDYRLMAVTTPRYARLDTPGRHCVSLDIVVWLPEDAALTGLSVSAITLTLRVLDDIKIDVSGVSELISVSGNVSFPLPRSTDKSEFRFHSRRLEVSTLSGYISGKYPLLDSLVLSSQSGKISASVWPGDADPAKPAPANLDIHTTSGDIDVHLPVPSSRNPKFTPPARDYTTNVLSSSGNVSGTFYLGSSTTIKTVSGFIKSKILPILQTGRSDDPDEDPKVTLGTETVSGRTDLEITDPIFISPIMSELPDQHHVPVSSSGTEARELRSLQSSHITKTGDIDVRSPDAWEGSFSGKTLSGDIYVSGKDLKVIKTKTGYVGKELLARKGVDSDGVGSSAIMETISGNLRFIAGTGGH